MPHVIAKSNVTGNYVPLDHPEAVPEIISGEKRKVTMRNRVVTQVADGTLDVWHEAIDYVPIEHVDQYAAEARTRWQEVTVDHSAGHDSGPGGDDQHVVDDDHPAAVQAREAL